MNKILAVAKREIATYLYTPMAYAAMSAFLLITGYFFSISVISTRIASVQSTLGNAGLIMVFIAPILTMRLLADESRQGTSEILFTTPVNITQVVIGKFLGSLAILTLLVAIMMIYPFTLNYFGNPDWGIVLSGYLGFWLMAAAFLAVGIFTSSLTNSQMVAGVAGIALLMLLWVIDWAAQAVTHPLAEQVLQQLSVTQSFVEFNRGMIDTRGIVFYLSLIVGFLFLSSRVLESRQWR